jgi:hypothetical protein
VGSCVFNVPFQQLDLVLLLDQLCLLVSNFPFQIDHQRAAVYLGGVALFAIMGLINFVNCSFLFGELALKNIDTCAEFCVFILKKISGDSLFHNVFVELLAILLYHSWAQLDHLLVYRCVFSGHLSEGKV